MPAVASSSAIWPAITNMLRIREIAFAHRPFHIWWRTRGSFSRIIAASVGFVASTTTAVPRPVRRFRTHEPSLLHVQATPPGFPPALGAFAGEGAGVTVMPGRSVEIDQ